jgi:DNA-binding transcriptional MerR regulator
MSAANPDGLGRVDGEPSPKNYSVGDLARLTGVSVRMLRHYDEIDLLPPTRVDPRTNYRYYDGERLGRLRRILALRELGFSLQQVGTLISERVNSEELRGMLRLRSVELANELAIGQQRLARVEVLIQQIEKENNMTTKTLQDTDVTLKPIPEMLVAQLSAMTEGFGPEHIGPVLSPLYPSLFERIAAAGLTTIGPPIAYYLDAPSGDGILVHAAAPILSQGVPASADGLEIVTMPAIATAATVIHRGSMMTIGDTYMSVMDWLGAHNLATIGYSREVYLDCPADQNEWVTEIQYAVTPTS